ncbi:MAG: glycosyltransferase family 4 protein [Bacteroidia bacterium]|nr:glycosyltransferase family 4 protein [Bacteroidia bacterium]
MAHKSSISKRYDVLIIGSLPAYLGAKQHSGLGNVVWGLAKELKKQPISFAIAAKGKYYERYKKVNGIEIYGLGASFICFLLTTYKVLFNFREVLAIKLLKDKLRLIYAVYFLIYIARKVDFDLIHLNHVTNQFPLAVRLLNIKVPVIAHIHSYSTLVNCKSDDKLRLLQKNINYQLSKVNYVIHVSKSVRKQGLEFGIKWTTDEKVVYNGIKYDLQKLKELECPTEKGLICFAGAFLPIKGVDILLKSLQTIKNRINKIVWIGEGPLRGEIENVCRRLDIKYEMTGMIPNEEVIKWLSRSQLLVVPSLSESFGQVYIESLLAGTPAIGYYKVLEEFNEAFSLDKTGDKYLIPFNTKSENEHELSEKIIMSLTQKVKFDDELRNKILSKTYWPSIIENYVDIYKRLLGNS